MIYPVLYLHNVDMLKICMKEFGAKNIIFNKMTAMLNTVLKLHTIDDQERLIHG